MLTSLCRASDRVARWGVALVLASFVCSVTPRTAHVPAPAVGPIGPDIVRNVTLPPGFDAAVDLATSVSFLRVVAEDLDKDGDLDVVANVGTLGLLVWENDGAGHFTRRWPSRGAPEFQALPPGVCFDGDLGACNEGIQNDDGRGLRLESQEPTVASGQNRALFAILSTGTRPAEHSVRTPRAPPLTLPL